jgi:hypothetical protein
MSIYIPTQKPEDWRSLLADPENHWKTGYSAKTLATCWEKAKDGFPPCVKKAFGNSGLRELEGIKMLLGIPEHQVDLPGGKQPSQTDLFVLASTKNGLMTIAVEGKVDEPFGPLVSEWLANSTTGKEERLKYLCNELGIKPAQANECRYQLLHRTVSALIEAKRYYAQNAMLLVHSFAEKPQSYDDYVTFAHLLGVTAKPDSFARAQRTGEIGLYLGWVNGDKANLK